MIARIAAPEKNHKTDSTLAETAAVRWSSIQPPA
jgi:hypothetical protein